MGVVVAYYGGRVLSSAAIVAVFWTSNVDVDLQQQLGSFYSAVVASSYVDWLEEYDTLGRTGVEGQLGSNQHIGRGQFAGAFTITPSTASVMLDNGQIASELAAQIAAGALPAPSLDSAGNVNTLYMVELPPGYTVTLAGAKSCADFCAYHWTATIGGKSVPYAVFPDSHACAGAVCGQGFDDETILRSHEMAEAITDSESGLVSAADVAAGNDVYPMGWSSDGGAKGEIGDLFFSAFSLEDHAVVAGYTVQKLWSNLAGQCVVGVPICDAATAPPACRPCTAYDDGAACAGATPVCEEATGHCRACQGVECVPADAGAGVDGGAGTDGGGSGDAGDGGGRRGGCASAGAGVSCVDALLVAGALVSSAWARRRRRRTVRGS